MSKPSPSRSSSDLSTIDGQDSSSTTSPESVEDVLASFREKWQKELKVSKKSDKKIERNKPGQSVDYAEVEDFEQQAKIWYIKGSENERAGNLYEAIQCYKRAVQLVPDIEFKISQKTITSLQPEEKPELDLHTESYVNVHEEESSDEDDDDNRPITEGSLLARIQRKINRGDHLFVPEYEQRTTHISSLPMEIILYILKWVVSSELDLRSLELCSRVSRGFYICARDQEIWRLACIRAWGVNCINLPNSYKSWRSLYLDKARLQFNGCYISKTTYIRHGENSFQDQFYRPWHIVAYYRYLRFFPDGQVLMLTTADEPAQTVGLLKSKWVKVAAVLRGHYRLKDDKVSIVVQQEELSRQANIFKRGRRKNDTSYESNDQTFHLELQIASYNKHKYVQLIWIGYSVFTRNKNGSETKTSFEVANNRFPPLWFSRVKSYTQESLSPLQ